MANIKLWGTTYNNVEGVELPVEGGGTVVLYERTLESKSVSYTPTETAQSDTVAPSTGYDGLSQVSVSVGAIASTYVGSGITRRTGSDLTATGATVTVPAGYYENQATKAVASGTAGTPTASKGTVSNHAVTVTPSVTNTAGYISGGTKTGTGVSVAASELVSGTLPITSNGTGIDVTNYQKVNVNVSGGGGASNIVTGTFTTASTKGAAATLSIPYTGSGYPVAGLFWISGGPYNNTASGNTTWYNSLQRYAIGVWGFTKARATSAPTYTGSGDDNACSVFAIYKNSTSTATNYSRNSSMSQNTLTASTNNASGQYTLAIRFKGNAKTVSYYVASTSYGLLASTAYDYLILYSS